MEMSRKFISALSGTTYNVHANEIASGIITDGEDEHGKNKINSPNANNSNSGNFSGRLSNLSALITGKSPAFNTGGHMPQPAHHEPRTIKCIVHFLDDTEHIFEVDRSAKGEELMDAVFRHLELIEREFFALQFTEIFHNRQQSQRQYQNRDHQASQKQRNVGPLSSLLSSTSKSSTAAVVNTNNDNDNAVAETMEVRLQPLIDTSTSQLPSHQNHGLVAAINHNNEASSSSTIVYNKWIDPTKKIRKQMRFCQQPYMLYFRVKFYVTEMSRLLEEYTRYHFYLQIRKDILDGRLCDAPSAKLDSSDQHQTSIMASLASYVLQSELGDYCEEEHKPGYSNQFKFIPNQTDEFCNKVELLHRLHQGQTPADAELNYLEEAKHLELYGVDLHNAKDCEQQDIKIGVSSNGLAVYKNHYVRINMFSWAKIVKISFKRRYFFIQLKHEGTERFDNLVGFNLCSYRACKSLWKSCVEQHTFFRLHTPKPLTRKFFFFFSLGSKFRYSGKTEFQTITENRKRLTRTERIFIRNNARNATMPASLMNTPNQKAVITDAQKHIVNLKLSTIADNRMTSTAANVVNTNGAIHRFNNSSGCSSYPNRHRLQRQQNPPQPHSPLSSMESTDGLSISSSSASSLLGPSSNVEQKITKKKSETTAAAKDGLSANNSVLHTLSSSGQKIQPTNMTINKSTTASHQTQHNHHQDVAQSSNNNNESVTNSSKTSSTSSLESSFMPNNNIDEHGGLILSCNGLKLKTAKQNHMATATIITIGNGNDNKDNKHCSIPSTFQAPTNNKSTGSVMAYTPSTLISALPYIDSVSTASATSSDKTTSIASLTNGSGVDNANRNDSQTPTLVEDLPVKDKVSCQTNNNGNGKNNSKFDLADSPIRELIKELYDGAAAIDVDDDGQLNINNVPLDGDSPVHVVTVTMKPHRDGPFGFNVKGGDDQNCPVLVSRVLPGTPADNAQPHKLHEGDQVLAINGVEVQGLKHEEVVQLIRSTKDLGPDAQLVLSIRPNVFHRQNECEQKANLQPEESPFHYTPSSHTKTLISSIYHSQQPAVPHRTTSMIASNKHNNDLNDDVIDDECPPEEEYDDNIDNSSESLLDISMNLLHEGLQGDLLIIQFECLARRNEDESITVARYLNNAPKNRYLDIAPYDSTRVVLKECNTGDYINASFVTMKVEVSNVINRYIATQGPLKRTTSDFWQMVWEQRSSLIVMVTPLIEDGRKKCFKYWPDEGQTMVVNDLLDLTLEECINRDAFLERKFKIIDPENKNTHYVTHLQYLAWPDQGVPDDDTDFLKLIFKVRELRQIDPDSPVIVHCSAGIGRTGVLILMETGICLIEANQPVYPLELVRIMRNQRAMLIQTSTQFRFVCEALYRVYRDDLVKPLDKYLSNIEQSLSPLPPLPTPPPPPDDAEDEKEKTEELSTSTNEIISDCHEKQSSS